MRRYIRFERVVISLILAAFLVPFVDFVYDMRPRGGGRLAQVLDDAIVVLVTCTAIFGVLTTIARWGSRPGRIDKAAADPINSSPEPSPESNANPASDRQERFPALFVLLVVANVAAGVGETVYTFGQQIVGVETKNKLGTSEVFLIAYTCSGFLLTYLLVRSVYLAMRWRPVTWGASNRRARIAAAILTILGMPGYIFCGFKHICMCGHAAHQFGVSNALSDLIWMGAFMSASVLSLQSDMKLRNSLAVVLPVLILVRIGGSAGGLFLNTELFLLLSLLVISIQAFRGGKGVTQPHSETRGTMAQGTAPVQP